MNVVGKVGSLISQGVYSVATPFHPFGGAVDVIVVQQQDGTFRSTPWYVRFGKFQGVLKGAEKIVRINVNGAEANFHMYLDNSGEAYFVKEVDDDKGMESIGIVEDTSNSEFTRDNIGMEIDNTHAHRFAHSVSDSGVLALKDEDDSLDVPPIQRTESDSGRRYYDFQDEQSSFEGSVELSEYESNPYETLDGDNYVDSQDSHPEMVLFSVDGHVLTAPISESEQNTDTLQLETPQFHLVPGGGTEFCEDSTEFISGESAWDADYISQMDAPAADVPTDSHFYTNGDDNISELQQEGHQEEEGHIHIQNQEEGRHMQNDSVEGASGITRNNVFKSCLELQEFSQLAGNADLLDKVSSLGDQHSAEDTNTIHPVVVENEEGSLAKSKCDGELSPSDASASSDDCRSSEVRPQDVEKKALREVETDSGRHSVSDMAISNDEHTGKSASTNGLDDIQQTLVSEDRSNKSEVAEPQTVFREEAKSHPGFEISLCGHELKAGIGMVAAVKAFESHRICADEFKVSAPSIIKNENLIIKIKERYLPWEKAAPLVLGMAVFGLDLPVEPKDTIPVEQDDALKSRDDDHGSARSGRRWRLWPIPFRKVKTIEHTSSNSSNDEVFVDSESGLQNSLGESSPTAGSHRSPHKQLVRTNVPTNEQIASLNLNEGQNLVTFSFSTRVLGKQQVDAHIYLWKWNARIVISDVDGTITKSDVLGQFMPLVGKDWTQSGVARLFSAIKENGYQLLFLSARAIVQAYLTRNFLLNLKQDGKALPNGPVVISPDGLFPSLYREVIRRAPHEFKIACLEDIKRLFPADYNPFYAGFGNRDTDELSYRKIGIPKGKIFIINPKGEVAISHRIDVKSYTSLHTLVNDMFPPTSLVEQEDFNSWNYWKMPLPDID
ncbi:phosphatidate phosphatase PAH1-like [Prosopis cineraria]|uniref:phosphatidate phosphatase PAH1-like n=1 Tax=Prosopis cineraria TaxID=364024 RepID=UPI00240EB8A0|nr:phosphatidate phosphatase PAH1-like [Prosopis cineraria]XP_054793766.1 phosphatidate phosphatase PAH1-like [Prosopis cineraria]XP_054802839.1 phosphatidate phosphatase PAH1-like [Prosopis cineraria]XP_054802840.1 phosphatidate phosphatase PAH1-like [Prosopis cineraria]XP_054802841.1 phosphatidate phosphatase PAH1-like [Prosopis cineraria]